jgi:hypothetical protein
MSERSEPTSKRAGTLELHSEDVGARILTDPYLDWSAREGVPIYEDFGLDLLALELRPWARFGLNGAIAHVKGRGDFLTLFVLEIPPGGRSDEQQHLFEAVAYGLSGAGTTVVETADGQQHSFEWGEKSLFAVPLNAKYRHFNASGREPARIAVACNFPAVMNLFHDESFVFANRHRFPQREGTARDFSGEGEFVPVRSGRHYWETNFVPDLEGLHLEPYTGRGAGGTNVKLILADGTMHAHVSEVPAGRYKKGHRHGPDVHVFCVCGTGYSLLWYDGESDFLRIDWRHGIVYAPPDQMFHQHFPTSRNAARYLALGHGSLRYPFTQAVKQIFLGSDVDVKRGGNQIEYADQDPRIHQIYLQELAKNGVACRMEDYLPA